MSRTLLKVQLQNEENTNSLTFTCCEVALGHYWITQWFRFLAVGPDVGSSIPHCASLTKARLNDP